MKKRHVLLALALFLAGTILVGLGYTTGYRSGHGDALKIMRETTTGVLLHELEILELLRSDRAASAIEILEALVDAAVHNLEAEARRTGRDARVVEALATARAYRDRYPSGGIDIEDAVPSDAGKPPVGFSRGQRDRDASGPSEGSEPGRTDN